MIRRLQRLESAPDLSLRASPPKGVDKTWGGPAFY